MGRERVSKVLIPKEWHGRSVEKFDIKGVGRISGGMDSGREAGF
jgi:hypothetical protein